MRFVNRMRETLGFVRKDPCASRGNSARTNPALSVNASACKSVCDLLFVASPEMGRAEVDLKLHLRVIYVVSRGHGNWSPVKVKIYDVSIRCTDESCDIYNFFDKI